MFNLIGIGEHAGSGVPDIFDVWENEGLETPTVEEQFGAGLPDRTTLTLPLINNMKDLSEMKQDFLSKSPKKSPEKSPATKANEIEARKESVLSLIKENPSLSKSKIARKLGISDRQVRTVLDYLNAEGKIHYEGTSRGGRWVID
jgi:predicted HTH transcriptional regulator